MPKITYLVSAALLALWLGTPRMSAAEEAGRQTAAYCDEKHGAGLLMSLPVAAEEIPAFDARCPTWPALALNIAAAGSKGDLEKMLHAGTDPNVAVAIDGGPGQTTPLDYAVRGNRRDNVELLLSSGASARIGNPVLALMFPIAFLEPRQTHAQRLELLEMLLAAGADPNGPCQKGPGAGSVLEKAAAQGDLELVERLLAAGATADGRICEGNKDYLDAIKPMLFGADIKPPSFSKTPPPRAASEAEHARQKEAANEANPSSLPSAPLAPAIEGAATGVTSQWEGRDIPVGLEIWRLSEDDKKRQFRRIAVRLVNHGATFIGLYGAIHLAYEPDPKLLSIGIAASRRAGYENEMLDELVRRIRNNQPVNEPAISYLDMLKQCPNKIMEPNDDHIRLCASEP